MPKRTMPNLTGRTFGRLYVNRELEERSARGTILFECTCSCPKHSKKIVDGHLLLNGHVRSCGCLSEEYKRPIYTDEERELISKFHGMDQRCNNPNYKGYADYGARGITLDFKSSDEFVAWGISQGYKAKSGMEIDRIDNSKGYSPSNCKFSTRREQQNNRRCTHNETVDGVTMSLANWERELGERPGFLADYARNRGQAALNLYIQEFYRKKQSGGTYIPSVPDVKRRTRKCNK